jgi:hypothetical protein
MAFAFIVASPAFAQPLSPLEVDQDGDGDLLNEEDDIRGDCYYDHVRLRGYNIQSTLTVDACNFVAHYLSGQCEDLAAEDVNLEKTFDSFLKYYLVTHGLLTRFNAILNKFQQKGA